VMSAARPAVHPNNEHANVPTMVASAVELPVTFRRFILCLPRVWFGLLSGVVDSQMYRLSGDIMRSHAHVKALTELASVETEVHDGPPRRMPGP
jgi:hypothetical protein